MGMNTMSKLLSEQCTYICRSATAWYRSDGHRPLKENYHNNRFLSEILEIVETIRTSYPTFVLSEYDRVSLLRNASKLTMIS